MKIVANKDKKTKKRFLWRVILDNGRIIPVPSQHNFKTDFIKRHGCSLVAFYMALRYKGVKKNMQQTLRYARRKLKCGAKYPLTEIARGINMICSGKPAVYHRIMSNDRLEAHLKKGHMILFEEGNPIHTVVLLKDNRTDKVWRFSDGRKNVTTVEKENKKKCTNKKYRGIVIVK